MQQLSDENLKVLRSEGIILDDDIAYKSADLLIAENVVSGKKRVLGSQRQFILKEEKKRRCIPIFHGIILNFTFSIGATFY